MIVCTFVLFSFGHCVVCSSIYGFWLPLWYLQTLLANIYSGKSFSQTPKSEKKKQYTLINKWHLHTPGEQDIRHFNKQTKNSFILRLFYLSRQIALTGYFLLRHTVTDRNIAFSDTSVTFCLLNRGNLVVNPVHFLLIENIKRGNQGIIILFYYLIKYINVDGFMWFCCKINTVLMHCLKI